MALTKIGTGGIKDDAASQAAIADEAVDEARLQISNAGSNGQFLQKQSGNTGGLTWASVSDTQLSTEQVQDIVGAMVAGNTETGIAVTYEDSDGTLDFVVSTPALATEATNVTAVANNSTNETVYPTFVDGATGTQGIETDTGLTYNPSTGLLTAVGLTLSGNLTVNGTTTTINSTTLAVDDKNIVLGDVDTPSDATADGGGITLKGATDKEIKWIDATDRWTFNQNIGILKAGQATSLIGSTDASGATLVFDGDSNGDAVGGDYSFIEHGSDGDFSIHADNPNGDAQFELYVGSGSTIAVQAEAAGAVHLSHNGSQKLSTSAAGVTVTGSVTDDKGNVRSIPQNHKTSAYTLIASDAGKCITITTGGVTLNQNIFSVGDAVTIINHSGSDQTITQGSNVTMYNAADASTGNRTLAARGMATLWMAGSATAYISGAGLS